MSPHTCQKLGIVSLYAVIVWTRGTSSSAYRKNSLWFLKKTNCRCCSIELKILKSQETASRMATKSNPSYLPLGQGPQRSEMWTETRSQTDILLCDDHSSFPGRASCRSRAARSQMRRECGIWDLPESTKVQSRFKKSKTNNLERKAVHTRFWRFVVCKNISPGSGRLKNAFNAKRTAKWLQNKYENDKMKIYRKWECWAQRQLVMYF